MNVIEALHWSTNPSGFGPLGSVIGIALHHTVTTISPAATPAQEEAHARAIDRYHVDQGWGGIGYHYLVFPSGRAYRVGWGQRAHVAHRNHELVGIAWVGNLSERVPSDIEIAGAKEAILDAWKRVGTVPLKGHREWAVEGWATSCPGRGIEAIGRLLDPNQEDEMSEADRERLARLEAIVAGNGLNVDVSEGNVGTLKEIGLEAPIVGTTIQLTNERALEFARLRGFSFALGLKLTIDRVAALEVDHAPGTPAPGEEIIITIGGERYRLVAEKETAS